MGPDFEPDGDIDGSDLYLFATKLNENNALITMDQFAGEFGR